MGKPELYEHFKELHQKSALVLSLLRRIGLGPHRRNMARRARGYLQLPIVGYDRIGPSFQIPLHPFQRVLGLVRAVDV